MAREARAFLREMVERLQPDPDAPAPETAWTPYRVLFLSYVEAHTFHIVARLRALSTRQLSREKARGIRLMRAALETPPLS